ncbi:DUF5010 domain-containing protein [Mucilaginibacter angelicae]|uniref:DUF5010 domain-containing protein n=1 Tax=Mucilaginibacter angelicae TaxID=869718 RepID=A0ABV6L163_9SPHI
MKKRHLFLFLQLGLLFFLTSCLKKMEPMNGLNNPENVPANMPGQRFTKLSAALPGQYVGVTMGFNGGSRDGGHNPSEAGNVTYNMSLFKSSGVDDDWWDNIAEELAYSGVDFVAPDCRGYTPNDPRDAGDPRRLTSLVAAMDRRGLSNSFKIALFDDVPASWTASRNLDKGLGYGYVPPFDCADTANYKYIWDYDLKAAYTAVPDSKRFKIEGRPVIIFWSVNDPFCTNRGNGNLKKILQFIRAKCQSTFGFNPYILVDSSWINNDSQCNDPAVIDGLQPWFGTTSIGETIVFNNKKIGMTVPGFKIGNDFIDPNHGATFSNSLAATVNQGSLLTLVEGFTDWEENATVWRSKDATYYDYPNQRINILRSFTSKAYVDNLKVEAEACDTYNDLSSGNSGNTFRDGNLDIVKTNDTYGGWHVTSTQAGEWMEWKELPLQASTKFQLRYGSSASSSISFSVDGTAISTVSLPSTAGAWATIDAGTYAGAANGPHTVRLTIISGTPNINFFNVLNTASGPISNGTYKIINRNSGMALDAQGQLTANGTPLQQWGYSGGNNQRWTITDLGGGQYKIIGVQSGRSLDVNGQSLADGAKIQLYDYNGGTNQQWVITATSGGYYSIKAVQSGKMMEIGGNSTTAGALVQQWGNNNGNNQQWAIQAP